jgi:hypothetical protein
VTAEEAQRLGRLHGETLRPLSRAEAQQVFTLLLSKPPKSRKQAA